MAGGKTRVGKLHSRMSSFSSKTLPDSFRRRMAKEERKELKIPTDSEACAKAERGQEIKMHNDFYSWCRLHDVVVVHSRTDRKPTIEEGHPDFTLLYDGKGCCVEFKAGDGNLSRAQMERLNDLDKGKVPYTIAWDLATAIKFATSRLGVPITQTES